MPRMSLMASMACSEPMMPGRTPRTPASAQFGTAFAAGMDGKRQR